MIEIGDQSEAVVGREYILSLFGGDVAMMPIARGLVLGLGIFTKMGTNTINNHGFHSVSLRFVCVYDQSVYQVLYIDPTA